MGRILVEQDIEAAIKGGAVFACGGGGWADHGRMLGRAAVNVGQPELVSIDELTLLATRNKARRSAFLMRSAAFGLDRSKWRLPARR